MSDLYMSEHAIQIDPGQDLPGQNCLIIELASGQLVLLGDFNLFRIDDADRELIETILDAVDAHRFSKTPFPPPEFEPGVFHAPAPAPNGGPWISDEELAKQCGTANVEPKPEEPTPEAI